MAPSKRTSTPPPPVDEAADRAKRVRAALARWAAESVSDEPEWKVEDVSPLALEPDVSDVA